jgi:hypothetical protein
MKHKTGDMVRIRSKEWIDAQEKSIRGNIHTFVESMFKYAGKIARIMRFEFDGYRLDVDDSDWIWRDFMFDPDYKPDKGPLSPKDAIIAMVRDRETLYDGDGFRHDFSKLRGDFIRRGMVDGDMTVVSRFDGLCRRPAKRQRSMTRWEILDWANSGESRGWYVRLPNVEEWVSPQCPNYDTKLIGYRRARLLPDKSGIDESTIQGFEVEE